ncbi:MAG: HD domain-containing protein [Myxococcota bacterium]
MTSDLSELRERIDADPVLCDLQAFVTERLDDDPGHDLHHAHRVALTTIHLLEGPPELERLAIVAALFHDLVNLPKNSPERAEASVRSAAVARDAMAGRGFPEQDITMVSDAVRDHSFSRGRIPETRLGKALQDADRLEALGALGLLRTISTGTRMGAQYFHAADPFARRGRELDDQRYSVDHFFQKLFDLPATMQTDGGRREARRRAQFLHGFLSQLGSELGETYR